MKKQVLATILLLVSFNLIAQKKTPNQPQLKIEGLWKLSKVVTYDFGRNRTSTIQDFYLNFNISSDAVFHSSKKIYHVIEYKKKFKAKTLNLIELGSREDTMSIATLATPQEVLFMTDENYHQEIRDFENVLLTKDTLIFKCRSEIKHRYFTFYFVRHSNQNLTSELFDEN